MTDGLNRLTSYLDEQSVTYDLAHHLLDFSAQQTARDTKTPGKQFAKTVVLAVDDAFAIAVLPAPDRVDLVKLTHELGAAKVQLANEREMAELFPDCDLGAESPFGNLYDLPVYVSSTLAEDEYITFNAGTHEKVIRMPYADFARLVRPQIIDMALSTW